MNSRKKTVVTRCSLAIPAVLFALCVMLAGGKTHALAGTHARAISTWDTTRSTIVFAYHHGFFLNGGSLNTAGYNANFTSTTGKLSAQFGLHYINFAPDDDVTLVHGISGSAIAMYGIPVASRHDNGLPKVAFTFYLGSTPTTLFNGEYNYTSIPINIGLGWEFSPVKFLSFTPWFEIAPSFNIDTNILPFNPDQEDLESTIDGISVDANGNITDINLNEDQVLKILEDTVDMEFQFTARVRGGLNITLNLGDKVDLQINGAAWQIGGEQRDVAYMIGGAFVFAWDDPPPAVLPEETRLSGESCPAVQHRFKECAQYQLMVKEIREEERKRLEEEMGAAKAEEETPVEPAPPVEEGPVSDEAQKSPVAPPPSPPPVHPVEESPAKENPYGASPEPTAPPKGPTPKPPASSGPTPKPPTS